MAQLERSSSFLPTIKCSSCARDIEIFQMGDHICSGPAAGEPTPPPDSYGNFNSMPYKQNPTKSSNYLKPGRMMPPKVDTSAANQPYMPQDQLTPLSASPSRSVSPMTPRSPFGRPMRSATAPIQRGPPSPDMLSSNLDCAFPPFPTSKTALKRRPTQDGYGTGDRLFAEPDQMYAPVSPRTASSQGVLQRMNTIAPGPFDPNGRKRPGDRMATRGHQRQVTAGSLGEATMSSRTEAIGGSIVRPATAEPGHSRSSISSSNGSKSGITPPPPKMPRVNGYGGFGPPSGDDDTEREPLRPEDRSQTFPFPNQSREPLRRPSEPANKPGARSPSNGPSDRWPMGVGESSASGSPPRHRTKPSGSGPDLTRKLPPRGASLIRPKDSRMGDAPPLPNVNLAAEFGIGNPYHTATESQSSDASGYSEESKVSSRSSPPRSNTPQSYQKPPEMNQVDDLMSEIQSSMADLQPRQPTPSSSPPRNRTQQPLPLAPVPKFGPSLNSPESPLDPAIQAGLSPVPQPNITRQASPLGEPRPPPARRPSRPITTKGNCKGCGEAIKGKSISSADGRLTGRYHKQCFVCKTCSEPFQTATFYVINDAPYCERHYHKLNGSVCATCDKGIEGQYLESQRKQKYHAGCLNCADCKRNLRNDYFEMNGRVYCERDAFRRAQQGRFLGPGGPGAGSNRMQRRTTRLMMM